jgi:hypothetical protein
MSLANFGARNSTGAFALDTTQLRQAFRNGIVEVIADDITFTFPDDPSKAPYYRTHHENYLKAKLPEYLSAQKALGIPLPLWCFLTLTGMEGVRIKLARDYSLRSSPRVRDEPGGRECMVRQ